MYYLDRQVYTLFITHKFYQLKYTTTTTKEMRIQMKQQKINHKLVNIEKMSNMINFLLKFMNEGAIFNERKERERERKKRRKFA